MASHKDDSILYHIMMYPKEDKHIKLFLGYLQRQTLNA